MRIILTASALLALAAPVQAQDIDFGDDASQWSNDRQCDDMRFEGSGMTTTILLESDIGHDASDCQAAFDAGNLVLIDNGDTEMAEDATEELTEDAAPLTSSISGGSKADAEAVPSGSGEDMATENLMIDGILFGDDGGQWANDGECDDRRFFGAGMTGSISWENLGSDASDCAAAYQAGSIRLWSQPEAVEATQCSAIDFGDDFGEYPNDSECDDYRFEGRAAAMHLVRDDAGHDASDCQRLCDFGALALRDY